MSDTPIEIEYTDGSRETLPFSVKDVEVFAKELDAQHSALMVQFGDSIFKGLNNAQHT